MKQKYYLFVIIFLLPFSSCKKFLETTPEDFLTPVNYYETEAQLKSALAGVYDRIGRTETYGDYMIGRQGIHADEGFYSASAQKVGSYVYNIDDTDPLIEGTYKVLYDGVNRANYLLANVDKPVMDEAERAAIKGEALFLRSYYYFLLVIYFGDIPLIIAPIASADDTNAPRTPAKEVYNQIIKDMTEAEGLVKTAGEVGYGGRVNKSAVRGILARVCLQMAGNPVNDVTKYAEARKWAKKVMDPDPKDGFVHALNPSYSDVFIKMCKDQYDVKESIWEIEYYGTGTDGFSELSRQGSNNGILYKGEDNDYGYSYGFVQVPARMWYLYPDPTSLQSSDERRDWSIASYKIAGDPAYETPFTVAQLYERTPSKWRRELEVNSPKPKNGGSINFPLLRFSDVLLMFAEADNMVNGPTAEGIEAVNKVRRRGYGKTLTPEAVKMITLSNVGAGYTTAPTITITGGGGSGATAKTFVLAGKLTRIKILTEGSGYTSNPVVSITGGGGTGAVAVPILSKRLTNIADLTSTQTADKISFQSLIEDERSRELGFECLRKADLVRWGKFLTNMKRIANDFVNGNAPIPKASTGTLFGALGYQNATARDVLWPFSPREMALNKNLRPQNIGW